MGPFDYILEKIEGDYAYLRLIDNPKAELFMIALTLLPLGADVGSKIHYENIEYTIM